MKSRRKGRTIAPRRPSPRRDPQTDFSIGRSDHVAFSPDGRRLVTLSRDVVLRDARDGRRLAIARPFQHPGYVAYTADGGAIIVKNTSGAVAVLDALALEIQRHVFGEEVGEGAAPFPAPHGRAFLDGSWDGRLALCDPAAALPVVWSEELPGMIHVICDGRHQDEVWVIVSRKSEAWVDDFVVAFDWRRRTLEPIPIDALGRVLAAVASPDRGLVALVRQQGLPPDAKPPTSGELQRMAQAAIRDGVPLVLELRRGGDGAVVRRVAIRAGARHTVAWHPDGHAVARVTKDSVSAFGVPELNLIARIPLPYASALAFSPSGEWLAAGSWEEGVCIRWRSMLDQHAL